MYIRKCFLVLACILPLAHSAAAQSYFTDCEAHTGDDATVILPASISPTIDGRPLARSSEIAVYTSDGLCAGVSVWRDSSLSITVWGDDFLTDVKDGFESGEALTFRVWNSLSRSEYDGDAVRVAYDASKVYFRSDGLYESNAIFSLAELSVSSGSGTNAPAAPVATFPDDGAVDMPRPTTLRWDPVGDALEYVVEIATRADFSENAVRATTSHTKYEIDSLQSATTYYWRVQSMNDVGPGAWSSTFRFKTLHPHEAPAIVSPESGTSDATSSVTFEWHRIEDAWTYQLQVLHVFNRDSMSVVVDTTEVSDTTMTVELKQATSYSWRVRATSGGFWGDWSPLIHFQTRAEKNRSPQDELPIEDPRLLQNYPNPFNPETTIPIELPHEEHTVVTVFDMLGRKVAVLADAVLEAGRHEIRWNAGDAPSGRYFYVLQTSTARLTRSLVLAK